MSEAKFVAGQWVTCNAKLYQIEKIDESDVTCLIRNGCWVNQSQCVPFVWQVGKTYKTTLDGVTVTVEGKTYTSVSGVASDKPGTLCFDARTGLLIGYKADHEIAPHLLPYLADEPPLVAEAATYSEFEDGDEREGPDALQSLLAEFSHRREQCQRMAESWETKAAEWRKAEQMIVEAIERAKR